MTITITKVKFSFDYLNQIIIINLIEMLKKIDQLCILILGYTYCHYYYYKIKYVSKMNEKQLYDLLYK